MKGILWAVLLSHLDIPKRYPNGSPHHITLKYGVERKDWEHWEGWKFSTKTSFEDWKVNIQAVSINHPYLGEDIKIKSPHITVSWCDGIKPVESNAMLENSFDSRIIITSLDFCIEFKKWG
ncbi:MAG: hypothetical protein ACKPKQ_21320 [Dolichospermum sp.]